MIEKYFQWWPEQASTFGEKVDSLFAFTLLVTGFFTTLIFVAIVYLALKYRRRPGRRPTPVHTSHALEITWSVIPLLICLVMFFWSAGLFVHMRTPPADAMQIDVVGKQWMWKLQHPTGKREINELHVPLGRPIKLNLTSQDVLHSFYVPAFRIKQDAVPGTYFTQWFTPTKVGEYHLFCAEYCGTDHSRMIGKVVVMEPARYQEWLAGTEQGMTPVASGEKLFNQFQCVTCHGQRGPGLAGVFGSTREFTDGTSRVADENYLRESILNPSARIVKGFQPLMPTFAGQLTEEQVMELIAYIKSLKEVQPAKQ